MLPLHVLRYEIDQSTMLSNRNFAISARFPGIHFDPQ